MKKTSQKINADPQPCPLEFNGQMFPIFLYSLHSLVQLRNTGLTRVQKRLTKAFLPGKNTWCGERRASLTLHQDGWRCIRLLCHGFLSRLLLLLGCLRIGGGLQQFLKTELYCEVIHYNYPDNYHFIDEKVITQ